MAKVKGCGWHKFLFLGFDPKQQQQHSVTEVRARICRSDAMLLVTRAAAHCCLRHPTSSSPGWEPPAMG